MKSVSVQLSVTLLMAIFCLPLKAQTIADLRDEISRNLTEQKTAKSTTGLVTITSNFELSGAHFNIDDESSSKLTTLTLPYQDLFGTGDGSVGLYVEGLLGYATTTQTTADLYEGAFPGNATSVKSRFDVLSGLLGAGPAFELSPGLTIAPIVNVGIAYLSNDTDYGGPGAALTAAIADGIAFNFESWIATLGVAGRAQWIVPLRGDLEFTAVLRYDIRWSETFDTDDPAQDFSARTQFLTLRSDLTGPTGWQMLGNSVRWRATASYIGIVEGEFFQSTGYASLGGGIELADNLPLGSTLSITGAVIVGDNITGWSLGLGLSF